MLSVLTGMLYLLHVVLALHICRALYVSWALHAGTWTVLQHVQHIQQPLLAQGAPRGELQC